MRGRYGRDARETRERHVLTRSESSSTGHGADSTAKWIQVYHPMPKRMRHYYRGCCYRYVKIHRPDAYQMQVKGPEASFLFILTAEHGVLLPQR